MMIKRRAVWLPVLAGLTGLTGASLPLTAAEASLPALLKTGACVVLLRHAQTDAGIGDPPGFQLGQCSTQRNLSPAGRAQARRIGQWFQTRALAPRTVQSSPWCRCRDTADLAWGRHTALSELGSTFDNRADDRAQTAALSGLLTAIPAGQFDVWVTHQVNITALTGQFPAMGEAFVVGASGQLLARTLFD